MPYYFAKKKTEKERIKKKQQHNKNAESGRAANAPQKGRM